MQGKSRQRRIIYIISAVFSLAVLVVGVFAWIGLYNTSNVNGIDFQINDAKEVELNNCQVYKKGDDGVATNISNETSITLMEYDTIFPERNANAPVIFRIELSSVPTTNPPFIFSMSCNGSWTDTGDASGLLSKNLSNIVQVRFGFATDELNDLYDPTDPQKNANEIYDGVLASMQSQSKALYFTTVAKSGSTYTNTSKVYEVSSVMSDYTSSNNKLVIYAMITYSDDLVNAYMSQHGVEISASGDESAMNFASDISLIEFSYDTED